MTPPPRATKGKPNVWDALSDQRALIQALSDRIDQQDRDRERPPPIDERLGSKSDLRRFSGVTVFKFLPGLSKHFTGNVPDEMWSEDVDHDEWPIAIIACVCGEEPRVRLAGLGYCECGRGFAHFGRTIRVATFDPADSALVD